MAEQSLTNPVTGDEVPKVDNAVAVGEDLAFQERWWKFERVIWMLFLLVLIADVLGAFGRGWLAKAKCGGAENAMYVTYERVQRAGTPSIMKVHFAPDAIVNNEVRLFVSGSVVKELGAQRVVPQSQQSIVGNGGITYVFAAQGGDTEVQFALAPSFPGLQPFTLQVPGKQAVSHKVLVMP